MLGGERRQSAGDMKHGVLSDNRGRCLLVGGEVRQKEFRATCREMSISRAWCEVAWGEPSLIGGVRSSVSGRFEAAGRGLSKAECVNWRHEVAGNAEGWHEVAVGFGHH